MVEPSTAPKPDAPAADLDKLKRYFAESAFKTQDARARALKCVDYYDSDQFSAGEIATLNARGQPPLVINRIKPAISSTWARAWTR